MDQKDAEEPAQSGKELATISHSLTHAMGPVGIKTMPGQVEIIKPLTEGPNGFGVADFGQGLEATECSNLLIALAKDTEEMREAKAKAKARVKAKAKGKTKRRAMPKASARTKSRLVEKMKKKRELKRPRQQRSHRSKRPSRNSFCAH